MALEARIDIITPLVRVPCLEEAYESILNQIGVQWRWLIQADGHHADLPARISADRRVSYRANAGSYGPASTRNNALMRSTAPLVFALDDDDVLYPRALSALAEALAEPDAVECYGSWGETYLHVGGKAPVLFRASDSSGVLPAGSIADPFIAGKGLVVHCGSVLWRSEYLVAFGGWSGLRYSEDTHLVVACDALFPSKYVPVPVYGYRTAEAQRETRHPEFTRGMLERHALIRRRAEMLRTLFKARGTW